MNKKMMIFLVLVGALIIGVVLTASAVSGAAFTTFNAHVDGAGKDVCKNSAINCNIYGAKEYVWLNGGPTANGLGPDGDYFFAVLVPGGQPNPNDGGAKNLSDDYDCYMNRKFTVTNGEVSAYSGYACGGSYPFQAPHWLDSGTGGPKPNESPPYIRLFPYADTWNPGGVYILAVCSLNDGYPVSPRDCKYDAFKVKKGKIDYSFYLSGMKFEDRYADGAKDPADPGLSGWKIIISGTGPDGLPFTAEVLTDASGFWEYQSPVYSLPNNQQPAVVSVQVCEQLKPGWTQSFPAGGGCHSFSFTPTGLHSFFNLDFGNWYPVDVTACKVRDLDGQAGGATEPVQGWLVSRTEAGVVVDTRSTGVNGCYTWTGLRPGIVYDVHEESRVGWFNLDPVDYVFPRAQSRDSFSHTFVNALQQGCTPGFWQGGSDGGQAGGKWLWNEVMDPQWVASGGQGYNPYIWTTSFNSFFTPYVGLNTFDMMSLVGTGGGPDDFQKAGRSLVAAYLNASWGMAYPYSTAQLSQIWADAVASGDFLSLHTLLDTANNAGYRGEEYGPRCPISASGW